MTVTARLLAAFALALPLAAAPARAQMDSREAISLQHQLQEMRREMELLRRGGGAAAPVPLAPAPIVRGGGGGGGGGNELVGQLLDRVSQLEEEVRRQRGRADEADNRVRQQQQVLEKLQGDVDYRLQRLEGGGRQGAAPAPVPERAATPAPDRPPDRNPDRAAPAPAPAAGAAPRTPERTLAEGQAALARRDYAASEAAAREVLAGRPGNRAQDAQLLLGDTLTARRDHQNAALAYDDAYRRNRQGGRAPEALLGLAGAFTGIGARREACDTLDQLRSEFPRLAGTQAERAAEGRRRAGCR